MTRRTALFCSAVFLCAPALEATWSIIIIDTRTKEIAIGSATCVAGFDLKQLASVVRVGQGAAAAQSYVDQSGQNRLLIWNEFQKGTSPTQILALLAKRDRGHQTRQYGIVDTQGRAIGFTGSQAMSWAGHTTGKIGTLVYAVQGNILTGKPVVDDAVAAIRNTKGDLAEKLMAAMEAARLRGGDRRCSSFKKSSHIGYMVVARQGDKDGVCNPSNGCASGKYYLNENVAWQNSNAVDPVIQLKARFAKWRQAWILRPDHNLSTVQTTTAVIPPDGRARSAGTVVLRDWRGVEVGNTAKLTVTVDPRSTTTAKVRVSGKGGKRSYALEVSGATKPGTLWLRVVADDGKGPVLLSPRTRIDVTDDPLFVGASRMSAARGGTLLFELRPGTKQSNRLYLMLGTASGTKPGIKVSPKIVIPVNPDAVSDILLHLASSAAFPGAAGVLDASGKSRAGLIVPAGALLPLLGKKLAFAFATIKPITFASNAVEVDIVR